MQKRKIIVMLTLLAALALSACGGGEVEPTPTLSVEQIETRAVTTYQAQLTQTALALPTSTPFPTNTPVAVVTFVSPTSSSAVLPTSTTAAGSGGSSACYGLSYVSDVTIPDNTEVTPGQSFTKTWRVLNSGTCAWEVGFVFNNVGGNAMSGDAVTLSQRVEPGTQYEFSVPMVAPTNQSGEVQGTWRLSDANGSFFGDGVFVLVEVSGSAPTATKPAATATEETTVPATTTAP
ncbi:MAG: NBR1-Ig-like domain-containing protein [Anaerolineales bacterium]